MIGTCLLLSLCCTAASAQAILKPPFGLRWGDSPEKLIKWGENHDLNITISLPGKQDGLSLLRIYPDEGKLPDSEACAVEARFLGGRLYELTVDYADPNASLDEMEARFETIKRQTTKEYGKLSVNQQKRTAADQFVTRTRSFHREPVKGLFLLLTYTELEDLLRKSKTSKFSLVYRNDNYRRELEKALDLP
ncbi:MAG: hypothetical protein ACO3SO_10645 [Luteolibacter sp.]